MSRVAFIIDGFNLYHSVREAEKSTKRSTKWLNIDSLCSSFLYLYGKQASLTNIWYFSALAKHLEYRSPDVVKRHQAFIKCLKSTGVYVQLGRFKEKDVYCSNCYTSIIKYEEKETDVAISVKLLELFFTNACDIAVLVTGDTDIAPAVRTAKKLFPSKQIYFGFPYNRKNKELKKLCPGSFNIKDKIYTKHQFPDKVVLASGEIITKPSSW